jgi:hypothetical protein
MMYMMFLFVKQKIKKMIVHRVEFLLIEFEFCYRVLVRVVTLVQ